MGDGPGEGEAGVLVDVARPVGLTHARHLGQTQRTARLVHAVTDVLPATWTRSVTTAWMAHLLFYV